MTAIEVRVRNTFNTYAATCKGRRATPTEGAFPSLRATCTAGPEHAVRALARKVFGDHPARLEFVSRTGVIENWRITA